MPSLPSWERGLKQAFRTILLVRVLSLPSWERGLKLDNIVAECFSGEVAPLVGSVD